MSQDFCPFTRTKKNDQNRFNPHTARVGICYQIHDDLRVLHSASLKNDDEEWVRAVNNLKMSVNMAKQASGKAGK